MSEIILPTKQQVDEILASLGKIGDAANQNGTAQAKLRHIVNTLATVNTNVNNINTNVSNVNTNVNTVNSNIGSNANAASATGSVHAKLKDIKNSLSGVGIKRVQRGSRTVSSSAEISISSVNMQKTFVNVSARDGNATGYLYSSTELLINTSGNFSVDWEVIEFY